MSVKDFWHRTQVYFGIREEDLQANVEKDPAKQQALIKEATALSDKANELRKKAAGN